MNSTKEFINLYKLNAKKTYQIIVYTLLMHLDEHKCQILRDTEYPKCKVDADCNFYYISETVNIDNLLILNYISLNNYLVNNVRLEFLHGEDILSTKNYSFLVEAAIPLNEYSTELEDTIIRDLKILAMMQINHFKNIGKINDSIRKRLYNEVLHAVYCKCDLPYMNLT